MQDSMLDTANLSVFLQSSMKHLEEAEEVGVPSAYGAIDHETPGGGNHSGVSALMLTTAVTRVAPLTRIGAEEVRFVRTVPHPQLL